MTANRRIFLNIVATYGRSLYALVCGLFTGRWLLMGLGEVDYGLFGLVGGLTAFIIFFNNLMATSVARYFAFYVGKARNMSEGPHGVEMCREWFTTAILVHVVVPLALIIVGYPMGVWAVERFLTIPETRICACLWVWRYSCISCFFAMVTVPFSAMYTAKQEIAELTVYSVVQTTANVFFMYYVVTHPGDWLSKYAGWNCFLMTLPMIILSIRAVCKYKECRFRWKYVGSISRVKELIVFAMLRFSGALAGMAQSQGMSILANKFLGPARNASMAIGNTLSSQSETLAAAFDGALSPAITNAAGAGDIERMRSLCYKTCKFSTVLMLIFALPLWLEVDEVMALWLGKPPAFASELCVCMLVCLVLEKIACGHWMAIFAIGRIGWYQLAVGACGVLTIPLAYFFVCTGMDLIGIGVALIVGKVGIIIVRLFFGKLNANMSICYWAGRIALPVAMISLLSWSIGKTVVAFLPGSFLRIVITSIIVNVVFISMVYFILFNKQERKWCVEHIMARLPMSLKRPR